MKKNILFIMADQHNKRCFSFQGHKDAKTPNLDNLASKGVYFDNAYCNNPICTPSRISFLSGLYPSTHGYYGLYGLEPKEKLTNMFSYFKKHGYRTGALGKLHTPRYWIERDCQFVYDEFIEHPKYLEGAGLYSQNDNRKFGAPREGECSFLPFEHSCESALVKQFQRFINHEGEPADRIGAQEPWFAWVSFARPHQPYTPSKEFFDLYDESSITLNPTSESETDGIKELRKKYPEELLRKEYKAYLALVSQVDYSVGMIIDMLKDKNMLENTIIVYTADHGDYASEHGLMEKKKGISHAAITKIPLIIVDPENKYIGPRNQVVQSVDLFATLCDLANIDQPDTHQGNSLKNIMENPQAAFCEYALTENVLRKAIATKDYRYITNTNDKDELYNINEDQWELNNLVDDEEYSDTVKKMQRLLIEALSKARYPNTTFEGFWHHAYNSDERADLTVFKKESYYS